MAVVTGANTGVGLETARGLARGGMRVVMACRDRERAERAIADVRESTKSDRVELLELDLASLASVRRAAEELSARHPRVHVLVNNAGLILSERTLTGDGLEATLGVNHLGHFLFTTLLTSALSAAGARVVNVASEAHRTCRGLDFDDLMFERRSYRGLTVYAASKLANILFTRELARRFGGSIPAHAVHPGVIASRFGRDGDTRGWFAFGVKLVAPLLSTPEQGARTSLHLALSEEAGRSNGRYWSRRRIVSPSRAAQDDAAARRLWEVSEQLVR